MADIDEEKMDRLAGLSPQKRELLNALLREKRLKAASAATISPRGELEGPLPLSFSQERLWLVHQLDPESPAYNIPAPLRFTGALDFRALSQSIATILRRHEALRTRFEVQDGSPAQVIDPPGGFLLPFVDMEGIPAVLREGEALRLTRQDAIRPFDLARGPVFRAVFLRLSVQDSILLSSMHHIVSDGWSTDVFAREMGLLYAAYSSDHPDPLTPLPIQYADFALWQRRTLTKGNLEKQLEFWRQRFTSLDPVLDLPSDRPRPALRTPRGGFHSFSLPALTAQRLRQLSAEQGTTLFATLFAGFFTLLHRQTWRDDLCIGTPVAGRRHVETEGLIGFFVNTLAVCADLSGDPPFRELVTRVHDAILDAQTHQDVPFDQLVAELGIDRSLSHSPIFQVLFALQNAGTKGLNLQGLEVRDLGASWGTTKFDLSLLVWDNESGINGGMEYSLDLYDDSSINRVLGQLRILLKAVAADPGRRLSDLPLLSPAERQQLLTQWGGTGEEPALRDTLHGRFRERERRAPEAIAVTCEGASLTYGELGCRARRLARRLRDLGAGAETLVGLCCERSLDLVVGVLGILEAGAAYVPLDPGYPRERLAYMIEDAGIRVLVGTEAAVAELPAVDATVLFDSDRALLDGLSGEELPPGGVDGASLAYVIYTSGSTGQPKGTLVSHTNVVRLFDVTWPELRFDERDVWTLFHSFAFDFSVWEIWGALLHGGRLVVVPFLVSRSPEDFFNLLMREQVTVLSQTPSAFTQLQRVDGEAGQTALVCLRLVIFGGEALDLAGLASWLARYGDRRPLLVNMYGITETTVHVTWRPLHAADARQGRSFIGTPLPDLALHVSDRWLHPAPVGVPGELLVGGAGLARGYLGRPDLTAARFIPDPVSGRPGARLYRSGDLGRLLPDGELEYLRRIDQQVKIRGFRIELGEIQAVLGEHPSIRESVVVVREDTPGVPLLVAYVVGATDAPPDPRELRALLTGRLPDYMVPASFIVLDALPLTANGKVDRKALPAPESARKGEIIAPRTPTEETLVEIWKDLLGLERVSVEDAFFELGGTSLLATRALVRIRQTFGIELHLREVFQSPTIAGLGQIIDNLVASPADEAELGDLLDELDLLSESEADARLGQLIRTSKEEPV